MHRYTDALAVNQGHGRSTVLAQPEELHSCGALTNRGIKSHQQLGIVSSCRFDTIELSLMKV